MHADMTSHLHHEAANTDSLTTLHAVLDDAAQGVFQGKSCGRARCPACRCPATVACYDVVRARAYVGQAGIEIYADDVACAHGAALGELDADALSFYAVAGLMKLPRVTCHSGFLWRPGTHRK